ncbi:MAG: cytochrome c [Lewinellaceae bacterium]|nr:cytochrome c [Lewinellaceae bacterium]
MIGFILIAPAIISGCKTPDAIANKSGAQLWAENCSRCHNTPDPTIYSDSQWDAATEHMRQKAILTDLEITKIRIFLKSAN